MTTVQTLFPQTLQTPRLTLEFFNHSPEHYDTLLTALNSETAHAQMGDLGVRTPEEFDALNARARLCDTRLSNGVADEDVFYLLRLKGGEEDGRLIGGVSLGQRRAKPQGGGLMVLPPDLGWCLLEGYMGKGYATEAAREVMRVTRDEAGIREVVAFASEKNPASNRVAEKLGFVDGGQCPDLDHPGSMLALYIMPGGRRLDDVVKDGLSLSLT